MKLIILSLVCGWFGSVHATLLLRSSGMYMSSNIGGAEASRSLIDVNPAYVRDKGWAFGALYQVDKVSAGASGIMTTSIGPSIGLLTRREFGFFGVATYFVQSKRDDARDGTGYQADVGYRFQFHRTSFAMQFSYKHFSYKASAPASGTLEVSRVDPYLGLWYEY